MSIDTFVACIFGGVVMVVCIYIIRSVFAVDREDRERMVRIDAFKRRYRYVMQNGTDEEKKMVMLEAISRGIKVD